MSKANAVTAAVAGAAMMIAAGAANAQGANPWTGLYVGVHAGYGSAKPKDGGDDSGVKGFGGGLYAGYNYQMSQIVLGVEGDYGFSNASKSFVGGGITEKVEIDNTWSIRARLGFLAMSNLMIYGTAGYGSFGLNDTITIGAASAKFSGDFRGVTVGGGAEMAFTRNISGRLEALHTIGKGTGDFKDGEANLTQIRAGLAYKF